LLAAARNPPVSLLEGQQAEAAIADKGYDTAETTIQTFGATAVIPQEDTPNSLAALTAT
jgi:hypothetical protein